MALEEALVTVWWGALVEGAEEVGVGGQRFCGCGRRRGNGCAKLILCSRQKLRGWSRIRKRNRARAQLARAGHKVMQFISAGRYIGNVVDGKVTIYGGKKRANDDAGAGPAG